VCTADNTRPASGTVIYDVSASWTCCTEYLTPHENAAFIQNHSGVQLGVSVWGYCLRGPILSFPFLSLPLVSFLFRHPPMLFPFSTHLFLITLTCLFPFSSPLYSLLHFPSHRSLPLPLHFAPFLILRTRRFARTL